MLNNLNAILDKAQTFAETKKIDAEVLLKATKVDGIYDKDPVKFADAKKFEKISYLDVLNKDLKVS
jgi:uridylate kinase